MFYNLIYNIIKWLFLGFCISFVFCFITPVGFVLALVKGMIFEFFAFLIYLWSRIIERRNLLAFSTNCLILFLFPFLFHFILIFFFIYQLIKYVLLYLSILLRDIMIVLNFFGIENLIIKYLNGIGAFWGAIEYYRLMLIYIFHFGILGLVYFLLRVLWLYIRPYFRKAYEWVLHVIFRIILAIIIKLLELAELIVNIADRLLEEAPELMIIFLIVPIIVTALAGFIIYLYYKEYKIRFLWWLVYMEWKKFHFGFLRDFFYSLAFYYGKFACIVEKYFFFFCILVFFEPISFIIYLVFVFFRIVKLVLFFFFIIIGDFIIFICKLDLKILFIFFWTFLYFNFFCLLSLVVILITPFCFNLYLLLELSLKYIIVTTKNYIFIFHYLIREFMKFCFKHMRYFFRNWMLVGLIYLMIKFFIKMKLLNSLDALLAIITYPYYYILKLLFYYVSKHLVKLFLRIYLSISKKFRRKIFLLILNRYLELFDSFLKKIIIILFLLANVVFYVIATVFLYLILIMSFNSYLTFFALYIYIYFSAVCYIIEKISKRLYVYLAEGKESSIFEYSFSDSDG